MISDYCFCVSWTDDEHAEPYVIQAETRDEAWARLCARMFKAGCVDLYKGEPPDCSVELQFVRPHSDNRHKTCAACHERLGPNPVLRDEYYYHEECQ
jgi:hypothetical protein